MSCRLLPDHSGECGGADCDWHSAGRLPDLMGDHLSQTHGRAARATRCRPLRGEFLVRRRFEFAVSLDRTARQCQWHGKHLRVSVFANLRGSVRRAASLRTCCSDGARRSMRVARLKEIERLEHSLATLATVGSTSPYVGLFGTVWGIMNAFSFARKRAAGNAGHGRAGYLRGPGDDGYRSVRSHSSGRRLQSLCRQVDRLELQFDTSWRSCRPFCSGTRGVVRPALPLPGADDGRGILQG